jgi:hypothetical protein
MILVLTGNPANPLVMIACESIDANGDALMHTCDGKKAESGVLPMGIKGAATAVQAEQAMARGVVMYHAALQRKDMP